MQSSANNRTEMFFLIEQWKGSGLSQKAYCRQQNLSYHVFHYWYKVYRDEKGEDSGKQASFIPLRLQQPITHSAVMELILSDGKRILFHQQPTSEFLKALL
jgi:hypothetical protein